MTRREFIWEYNGEEYLHRITWRVVERQFERPADPEMGAAYDELVAMVFASHTFEGYLNFLGDKILPEVWKNEREIEGGLEGKLHLILRQCDLPDFNEGQRPWQTVRALTELRNWIAHPKTHKPKSPEGGSVYAEGKELALFRNRLLKSLVSRERALRARDDVKSIVDTIHARAIAKFPELALGDDGLLGILSRHIHRAAPHDCNRYD